jgi:DNA-damage-inducible protein D
MATDDTRSLALALVEEQADASIRRVWHDGRWFFSVIDVVGVLTDSANPGVYWRVLKSRLNEEGGDETVTKCNRLKMTAADGKQRTTDAADTETMLRLIQSIPSPKAEPVKQWLARVGAKHLDEVTRTRRSPRAPE